MFKQRLILCFLLVALPIASVIGQKNALKGLDSYLEEVRKSYNVPGMGVALVKDGKTIYEKGFGVKSVESADRVDANSLFAIASNSKAYTATMLAMLVEEGKLNWTDRVQQHLPWFELYDPYVSAEMTIEDLLCHRSGLATFSGDLIWYGSKYTAEEVVRRAKHLEPVFGFRAGYGYQNIMFIAAGLVLEEITGKSWSENCRERILKPLGMNSTLCSITEFNEKTNLTTPHNTVEGKNVTTEWVNWDNVAAAGGLISSVHDEAEWLKFNLNKGIVGKDTLMKSSSLKTLWELHNNQPQGEWSRNFYSGRALQGYGLGWQVMVYKGKRVIHHGGGYDGMISHSFFLPEDGIGGVVLTNNITSLSYFLCYELIDRMIAQQEKEDWPSKVLPLIKGSEEGDAAAKKEFEAARVKDTKPSLGLSDYAGTYRDKMYGDLILTVNGEKLDFQFEPTPIFKGSLSHWHYDTFLLRWGSQMMLPEGTAQFVLNPKGLVEELKIDVPNPDFDFTELHFKRVAE